jgi:hypothetical protein
MTTSTLTYTFDADGLAQLVELTRQLFPLPEQRATLRQAAASEKLIAFAFSDDDEHIPLDHVCRCPVSTIFGVAAAEAAFHPYRRMKRSHAFQTLLLTIVSDAIDEARIRSAHFIGIDNERRCTSALMLLVLDRLEAT